MVLIRVQVFILNLIFAFLCRADMQCIFYIVCLLEMPLGSCRYQYFQCQCSEKNVIGVKMQKILLSICQIIPFIFFSSMRKIALILSVTLETLLPVKWVPRFWYSFNAIRNKCYWFNKSCSSRFSPPFFITYKRVLPNVIIYKESKKHQKVYFLLMDS